MKRLVVAGIILAASSSCKRDALESITEPQTGPYSSMQDFYNMNAVQPQTFTINPDVDTVITGNQGTRIYLENNSLYDASGNPPSGNITVILKEVYHIKDMILSHVTTTSGGSILQSGGMFYLTFASDTVQYFSGIVLINVKMPSTNPGAGMDMFYGMPDSNAGVNWVVSDSSLVIADSLNEEYNIWLDSLGYGWVNIDMFYISQPLTSVTIVPSVTSEHGETVDLAVYLAFPAINSCMNVYSSQVQQSVTVNNVPVGMQAAAVIIGTGRVTKKPYFGLTTFTVTAGQPVNVSVVQTGETDIISSLQVL